MKTNKLKSKQSILDFKNLKNQVISKNELSAIKGGNEESKEDIIIIEEIAGG